MPIRVELVSQHQILRQGLRTIEFAIVGEAGSGSEAVELARRHHPDVAVVDIGVNGLELTAQILQQSPRTKVRF